MKGLEGGSEMEREDGERERVREVGGGRDRWGERDG